MKLKIVALLLVAASLSSACGSNGSPGPQAASSRTSPTAPPTKVSGLVGRWQRVTKCQELVSDLKQAGLGPVAPYA
jgi:hypothetical protein